MKFRSRAKLEDHLAIYTAFHRSLGNRILHGLFVPVVLYTGAVIMDSVQKLVFPNSPGLYISSLALIFVGGSISLLSRSGALILFLALFPAVFFSETLISANPPLVMLLVFSGLHALAWFLLVVVGHEKVEPLIRTDQGREDSNLYFRRHYYLARNWGIETSLGDLLAQFNIAPLAVVQDLMVLFGFGRQRQARIERKQAEILDRIDAGKTPFEELVRIRRRVPVAAYEGKVSYVSTTKYS